MVVVVVVEEELVVELGSAGSTTVVEGGTFSCFLYEIQPASPTISNSAIAVFAVFLICMLVEHILVEFLLHLLLVCG